MTVSLSHQDRIVFYFLEQQHDHSVSELAALTNLREHIVRYTLRRLERFGYLRPEVAVDQAKLGWVTTCMYFSLQSRNEQAESRFLEALVRSPRITWVAEIGGAFQFEATLITRNEGEIASFLDQLPQVSQVSLAKRSMAIETRFANFGLKYLVDASAPSHEPCIVNDSDERVSIKEIDHRILWALCNTNYKTQAHLARTVGISSSTLEFRIKKLEQQGVIKRRRFVVDHSLHGAQCFYIFISSNGRSPTFPQRLLSFCQKHPNILVLIRSLGNYDYKLISFVQSAEDASALAKSLAQELDSDISDINMVPRFRAHKHSSYPCHIDWSKQDLLFEEPLSAFVSAM